MKRRDFLQHAAASFLLPVLIDGYGAKAFTRESAFMQALAGMAAANDHILVLIQLNGGNDGLNTVIPLDQLSLYTDKKLRGNIAIPEGKILKLNNHAATGLHPAMTGMQQLFNDGKLSIIHSVSYPVPNFSHFRASDIWFTAADSDKTLTTGWMGRYLDDRYPDYPEKYPNATMPDPLAVQIGAISSTALLGLGQPMGISLQDPDTFAQLVGDKPAIPPDGLPDTYAGRQVGFIRQQQTSSVQYAAQLKTAAGKGKNLATYPANNSLAAQLKIVARLIGGGLQTRVYYVTLGGFDTHAAQVDASNTTVGNHANLLKTLSDAVLGFQNDLKAMGMEDKVAGMTFSEFGRRAVSNNSFGTDHGVAAPLFVFGAAVKTQVIGTNPNLSDLDNNNIKMQHDFRQVYATMLDEWLGTGNAASGSLLFKNFDTVPIFRNEADNGTAQRLRLFPNPADHEVFVKSGALAGGVRSVRINDLRGYSFSLESTVVDAQKIRLDTRSLPSGHYIVRVETNTAQLTGKLVVAH